LAVYRRRLAAAIVLANVTVICAGASAVAPAAARKSPARQAVVHIDAFDRMPVV